MTDVEFKYDCFISYRRSDGTRAARWLRRGLLNYRLPASLQQDPTRRLSVYLDTDYERSTEDFFDDNIAPALKESRYLLVVATPDANLRLAGNRPNWVEREIENFLQTPQGNNILAVRGAGNWNDPFPGDLQARFPYLHIVDGRNASTSVMRQLLDWMITPAEITTLGARLFGIPQEKMPELRQEETKRARFRVASFAAVGALTMLSIASLAGYAWYQKLKTDAANQVVLSRYLAWQSGVIANEAPRRQQEGLLLAIEGYRRDASAITAAALHDRVDPTPLPVARFKHASRVNVVKYTPDGKYLVTASDDGLSVWDPEKNELRAQLSRGKPVRAFEFGPNDGEITALFRRPPLPPRRDNLPPDPGQVVSWRWADNTVTKSYDASASIRRLIVDRNSHTIMGVTNAGIWRAKESRVVPFRDFKGSNSSLVELSPTAAEVAVSERGSVHIFETQTGHRFQTIRGEDDARVSALRFSPTGDRLYIGRSDGKTHGWLWRTMTQIIDHQGYSDPLYLAPSPDGKYMAEIDHSLSSTLRVWKTENADNVLAIDRVEMTEGEYTFAAAFSTDSRFLYVSFPDRSLHVIRVDGEESTVILKFTAGTLVRSIAPHPSGKFLAAAGDDGWATIWRMDRSRAATEFKEAKSFEIGGAEGRTALIGRKVRVLDRNLNVLTSPSLDVADAKGATFSRSGRMLALWREDGGIAIIDLAARANGQWVNPPPRKRPAGGLSEDEDSLEPRGVRFTDDETKLVIVRRGGISELDLTTRVETQRLEGRISSYPVFSPDSYLLATKSVNGPVNLYNLKTFRPLWEIAANSFDTSIAFSPDGKLFAARTPNKDAESDTQDGRNGMMTVWNIATRKVLLTAPVKSLTSDIAFSARSEYFAFSDDEKIHLWDLTTRKPKKPLALHMNKVGGIAFHPSEPLLAAGYADKRIRVWKIADGQMVTEVRQDDGFDFGSEVFQFTRDGRYLVRAQGYEETAFIGFFAWRPDELIAFACARALEKKLGPALWGEHLPGQPYRETCSEK